MGAQFVHLRNHSEFSIRDGLLRVKTMASVANRAAMPAIALTDLTNFYGLVKFQKACFANGVKPIYGVDIEWIDESDKTFSLTLLAKNSEGYKNLLVLISRAYTDGQDHRGSFLKRSWIAECADGVIALSGAMDGDIGEALVAGQVDLARSRAEYWSGVFPGNFYIDVQRLGAENESFYIESAVALADDIGLPLVATNSNRFVDRESFEAHEVRVCINDGRVLDDPKRPRKYTQEQYIKTPQEMAELFKDIPDAIENTVRIAERCSFEIPLGKYYLPDYPIPEGKTLEEYFRELSHEGLSRRFVHLGFDDEKLSQVEKTYRDRLDFEVDIILQMGFPGYFLIVMDFIRWAKENEIPVGPGRGSGAGSLVAYALEITDLDPIEYDLLFERFLNPERVSMPDFDVDFCMDKRDQVISYVSDRYGREAVGQIVTFGTMAAKAVVRDVARAQGKSYGLADKLSKMIPFEVGMTLQKAYEAEEPLRDFLANDADAQEIWDMALMLEGTTRNLGKHAGGVVIAPSRLTDFSPLYCDETGQGLVTQYDKNDVEDAGLVKFDFLGLRTLTIIDWALKMINSAGHDIDISTIPLDCQETFALLQSAQTTAVFQLESRGMKDLIKRLKPDCFEDIVALVALFRPGPLQSGMVDDFINRKLGRAELAFPHPKYQHECLQPILSPTYGIILYQEQVMQIAQSMAGYSLGEADLLRRAMGKKKPEEMAAQGKRFMEGALERGHDNDLAKNIFDLMEKFAGYGFNKSHSAAYALVSYQTAWLKKHHAPEFMAAVLSSELQNTDKIVTLIEECREIGVAYAPPSVNEGSYLFTVSNGKVIYGLGAIKGLGEGPVNSILEARQSGPFTDLFDFCNRTDSRKLNKRALEALIRAGAFDAMGTPRWVLLAALPNAIKAAEQAASNADAGITDLFGGSLASDDEEDVYADYRGTRPWLLKTLLDGEKDTLGLYLSGHPIDSYEQDLSRLVSRRLNRLQPKKGKQRVVGMVVASRVMKTKKGDPMGFVTLDDRTGRIECSVFTRVFAETRELLKKDAILVVDGEVKQDDYTGGLAIRADSITSIEAVRSDAATAIEVSLNALTMTSNTVESLANLLETHKAGDEGCRVLIRYQNEQASSLINTDPSWRVLPTDSVVQSIQELVGESAVKVLYTSGGHLARETMPVAGATLH